MPPLSNAISGSQPDAKSPSSAISLDSSVPEPAKASDYLAIMRLDHATKHVFILPGVALAFLLRPHAHLALWPFIAGAIAAVSIASANYVINEYLDREFDALHPTKSLRTAVHKQMSAWIIAGQWLFLVLLGLNAAGSASMSMLVAAGAFAAQGVIYNVRPMRTKDVAYLDVISESVNNPVRLLIGWAMIDPHTLPPASIIAAYWMGGAFLMATKRLSEYREIAASHGALLLSRYRKSFGGYDETSLAASCLVYALLSAMTLAIFFVKYRIEYLFVLPPLALLFGQYLAMSMHPGSTAQKPEKLFAERGLIWLVLIAAALFGIFTVVDIPALQPLTSQQYIRLG